MPCTKCKDEKYKWGESGECKYESKEACEKANPKNYNKMRPTPLGKKSYEEYEKELKEFNLSTQKADFSDMKTLGNLYVQIEKIVDGLDKQGMDTKLKVADYNEADANHQADAGALDRDFEETRVEQERVNEQKKILEKAEQVYFKTEKRFDKSYVKREKSASVVFKSNDKYEATWKKGEAIADKMKKAIKDVESQAKALGVEVPLGTYKQVLAKFNATPNNSLKNVNFDY